MLKQIPTLEYIKNEAQSGSTEDMLFATIEFIQKHMKAFVEVEDGENEAINSEE